MLATFYIGKRTLYDILRTGVFWVALGIAAFICFALLYWGWHAVQAGDGEFRPHRVVTNDDPDAQPAPSETDEHPENFQDWNQGQDYTGDEWDPMENIKPETMILWNVYGTTIFFSNILAIFMMMGLLSREIDRRTLDLIISRPVSRTQIFLGKLFAGWAGAAAFMVLLNIWILICMIWGGMGVQKGYLTASAIGLISPLLVGSITLVLSIWMRGFVAGLLAVVISSGAGNFGLFMIKLLGIEILKLKWPVWTIYKILPPLNVIGQKATNNLEADVWFKFVHGMFENLGPRAADGLYTELWHVWVYLGVVLLLGWIAFFRKQFT